MSPNTIVLLLLLIVGGSYLLDFVVGRIINRPRAS